MSIPVPLEELAGAMQDYDFAYLAINGARRPHLLAVRPRLVDGVLLVDRIGRTVSEHDPSDPGVTLVFPPRAEGGRPSSWTRSGSTWSRRRCRRPR